MWYAELVDEMRHVCVFVIVRVLGGSAQNQEGVVRLVDSLLVGGSVAAERHRCPLLGGRTWHYFCLGLTAERGVRQGGAAVN